ncbi:hypothetical protein D9M69_434900 [compost metagenome]
MQMGDDLVCLFLWVRIWLFALCFSSRNGSNRVACHQFIGQRGKENAADGCEGELAFSHRGPSGCIDQLADLMRVHFVDHGGGELSHPVTIEHPFVVVAGVLDDLSAVEPGLCILAKGRCQLAELVAGVREQFQVFVFGEHTELD